MVANGSSPNIGHLNLKDIQYWSSYEYGSREKDYLWKWRRTHVAGGAALGEGSLADIAIPYDHCIDRLDLTRRLFLYKTRINEIQ